ncbi:acetoacetate metabolism regulatory protein AtoC [compost metagenome]
MPLISEAAQLVLERHSWPGNTRELENVIHFALLVSTGDEILPEHLNLPVVRPSAVLVRGWIDQLIQQGDVADVRALREYFASINI